MFRAIINFVTSPLGALIGWIIGPIGVLVAVVVYFKQKKDRRPVYGKQTFPLIFKSGTTPKKLELFYDHKAVEKLTLTKFAFWNAGRETIRKEDISAVKPITIKSAKGATIYDSEIAYSELVNNFKITKIDDFTLGVDFDFIDLNQGMVVNLYHNGDSSDDIICEGAIIGGGSIKRGAVSQNVLFDKVAFISNPVSYLVNSDTLYKKIIGWVLVPPTLAIVIPVSVVVFVLTLIYVPLVNFGPKRFLLKDG